MVNEKKNTFKKARTENLKFQGGILVKIYFNGTIRKKIMRIISGISKNYNTIRKKYLSMITYEKEYFNQVNKRKKN